MKMKKFLIYYFIFLIFSCISILILRVSAKGEVKQIKTPRKKIVVIETEKLKPMGMVICQTASGCIFSEWMEADNAIIAKREMEERYRNNKIDIFIRYDKYPY